MACFFVLCYGVSAENQGLSSYENLLSLDDPFITRMLEGGATSEEIERFLDDVDTYVDGFQNHIYKEDADLYFIYIILQIMQREKHLSVLVAFDMTCQEEITYMNEHRKVPKNFSTFMMVVMSPVIIVELVGGYDPGFETETMETIVEIEKEKTDNINETPFSDIDAVPWCVESVNALYAMGIIKGTSDSLFEPTRTVSREEYIKMIVELLLDKSPLYSAEFSQDTLGKWYHDYTATAAYYSLTTYLFEEPFMDDKPLSRQDMATITYRAALRAGLKLPKKKYATDFLDSADIKYYAIDAIKYLQEADILATMGTGYFEPEASFSRAEAAVIIYKLNKIKNS